MKAEGVTPTPTAVGGEVFDYCIVGGGAAGCVLASRLTEDPSCRVLLLEAGPPDRHPFIHIPAAFIFVYRDQRHNWHYQTEPDPSLDGRTTSITQGKVLGGSSSINGMLHVRAHKEELDAWVRSGCTGWSHEDLLPYYCKAETYLGPSGDRVAGRGYEGPLGVTYPSTFHPLTQSFVQAAQQAGLPFLADMNGPSREGVAYHQQNRRGRLRSQPAQSHLRPARGRSNLTVRTGALVTRVHMAGRRA
ncbi:MAG: choline dehydrogenase, partial [Rhodoferax sp.]|nr:choline dehydrogenase [Rhodoferax sp.]